MPEDNVVNIFNRKKPEPKEKPSHGAKKTVFEYMYMTGVTGVMFNVNAQGVIVPGTAYNNVSDEGMLTLNFSVNFRTESMSLDDKGIRDRLSFDGTVFDVFVPWDSISAMKSVTTKELVVFPELRK